MKFRKDFVTNSSSSSYTCEICGHTESGWDICLSEARMVECVNGHIYCESEMLPIPRQDFIKAILALGIEDYSEINLDEMSDEKIKCKYFDLDDGRWSIPEECCPLCQFIEYSDKDMSAYLLKKYGVPYDEVFAKIKELNKRRKKLYDNEYITEICQRFNLNLVEIPVIWKDEFKTYKVFRDYLRS